MRYLKYSLISLLINTIPASATAEIPTIEEDAGSQLYPSVQKVTSDFYTAKMADHNLSLVMERIDDQTHPLWLNYITVQSNPRVIEYASNGIKGSTVDGALHFKAVLNETSYEENEMWVAYITKDLHPQAIPNYMKYYDNDSLRDSRNNYNAFAKDIEMFVTITSSPLALITSHMGIAFTVEGAHGNRTLGTSVDLHSFAAKVMLRRNPKRKYMVNAPNFAMRKIIVDKLPDSVFVGTREMQEIMMARRNLTFEDFAVDQEKNILDKLRKEAEKDSCSRNNILKRNLRLLKEEKIKDETEESLRQEAREEISEEEMIEMDDNGNFVVSEQKIALNFSQELEREFIYFKNPYTFPGIELPNCTQEYLKLMEQHPPLLSVDKEITIQEHFTLFNMQNPTQAWLSVESTNPTYQWMFTRPFKPAGVTHYMVVDLKALAEKKAIE